MNVILENKVSMCYKIRTYFKHQLPTLAPDLPALPQEVTNFNNLLTDLEQSIMRADEDRTGATLDKNYRRSELHNLAFKIAAVLYAIASVAGNEDLMQKTKITNTRLRYKTDIEILYWCQELSETAAQHSAELLPYAVDAAMLAAHQEAILAFRAALQIKTQEYNNRLVANIETQNIVRKIMHKLKIIDTMMLVLSNSHSQLYYQYLSSRKIDNL